MIRKTALALLLAAAGVSAHAALSAGDTAFTLAVPEPNNYAMLLAGLGLMGAIALRRTRH